MTYGGNHSKKKKKIEVKKGRNLGTWGKGPHAKSLFKKKASSAKKKGDSKKKL